MDTIQNPLAKMRESGIENLTHMLRIDGKESVKIGDVTYQRPAELRGKAVLRALGCPIDARPAGYQAEKAFRKNVALVSEACACTSDAQAATVLRCARLGWTIKNAKYVTDAAGREDLARIIINLWSLETGASATINEHGHLIRS